MTNRVVQNDKMGSESSVERQREVTVILESTPTVILESTSTVILEIFYRGSIVTVIPNLIGDPDQFSMFFVFKVVTELSFLHHLYIRRIFLFKKKYFMIISHLFPNLNHFLVYFNLKFTLTTICISVTTEHKNNNFNPFLMPLL